MSLLAPEILFGSGGGAPDYGTSLYDFDGTTPADDGNCTVAGITDGHRITPTANGTKVVWDLSALGLTNGTSYTLSMNQDFGSAIEVRGYAAASFGGGYVVYTKAALSIAPSPRNASGGWSKTITWNTSNEHLSLAFTNLTDVTSIDITNLVIETTAGATNTASDWLINVDGSLANSMLGTRAPATGVTSDGSKLNSTATGTWCTVMEFDGLAANTYDIEWSASAGANVGATQTLRISDTKELDLGNTNLDTTALAGVESTTHSPSSDAVRWIGWVCTTSGSPADIDIDYFRVKAQ